MLQPAISPFQLCYGFRKPFLHSLSPEKQLGIVGGRGVTTYLVKHDIVGAAERPTPVLKNLANGVDLQGLSADREPITQPTHTDLLPDLLIDDNVD
jgi:hypothetical protein